MSCIYKGKIIDTNLSKNSAGGTEQMRSRLLEWVDSSYLKDYAIHFSRPRELYSDVENILYCHDLEKDPENKILLNGGWKKFTHIVFVSYLQRDKYISLYNIPYSKCSVIENAIPSETNIIKKDFSDPIRFIYHTTPHRGLDILYSVFNALSEKYDNIHLDVFSSFEIYGWKERDKPYEKLFQLLDEHPKISNHGYVENTVVRDYLKDANFFFYPCTWEETSCIALIEAMMFNVIPVIPKFGALTETSVSAPICFNYEFTDNKQDHANIAYGTMSHILENLHKNKELFETCSNNTDVKNKHNLHNFKQKWESLLRKNG